MIDLHSHILPGLDDGSRSLEMSLEMARIAVADGIATMACTPHIYPGLYLNDAAGISAARDALQAELDARGIALQLTTGADLHLVPGLVAGLRAGSYPSLHGSRYVLLEPSHHHPPPRFAEHVFELVGAGYVPVLTHPERLGWLADHYQTFVDLTRQGCWLQLTAGALTGLFGSRPRYWGERLLGDGLVHLLATDCHSNHRRVPVLSEGLAVAERILGVQEARHLVQGRARAVLDDLPPSAAPPLPARATPSEGGLRQLLNRWRG